MQLPAKLREATQQDFECLIAGRVEEGPHLDFKRGLPQAWNEKEKHELAADASAFANTGGGDLIYGLDEVNGVASVIAPVTEPNMDATVMRLQQVLMDTVEPRMEGVEVVSVAVCVDNKTGYVVVVRVPQSWVGPHRVTTNQHFFARDGARKRPLDVPEIRSLFLRTEGRAQGVRKFRAERIGRLVGGEHPTLLATGPCIVIHLIPIQSLLGGVTLNTAEYDSGGRSLPSYDPNRGKVYMNFDGALLTRPNGTQGARAYTQMFRDGSVEAVDVLNSVEWYQYAGYVLRPWDMEGRFIRFANEVRAEYGSLGVAPGMVAMLSLVGVKGVAFENNHRLALFDRDILVYPDVLIEGMVDPAAALRPLFDHVWQSAGFPCCLNYDQATGQRNASPPL